MRSKYTVEELLDLHRWDINMMVHQDWDVVHIAQKLGVTTNLVSRAAKHLGLKIKRPSRYAPQTPKNYGNQHRGWWPAAIEMRENGKATYQQIGDAFGVSRERIRQILLVAGRRDLMSRKYVNRARETPIYNCAQCEKPYAVQPSHFTVFCSKECGVAFRAKELYKRDLPRAEKILARRQAGKTWELTAAYVGFSSGAACYSWLRYFCAKHSRPDLLKQAQGIHGGKDED